MAQNKIQHNASENNNHSNKKKNKNLCFDERDLNTERATKNWKMLRDFGWKINKYFWYFILYFKRIRLKWKSSAYLENRYLEREEEISIVFFFISKRTFWWRFGLNNDSKIKVLVSSSTISNKELARVRRIILWM